MPSRQKNINQNRLYEALNNIQPVFFVLHGNICEILSSYKYFHTVVIHKDLKTFLFALPTIFNKKLEVYLNDLAYAQKPYVFISLILIVRNFMTVKNSNLTSKFLHGYPFPDTAFKRFINVLMFRCTSILIREKRKLN